MLRNIISFSLLLILLQNSATAGEDVKFQYKTGEFIHNWLIRGPFPNCATCLKTDFKHSMHCNGFYTDYLQEIGGEKDAVPTHFPDLIDTIFNQSQKWHFYKSKTDKIPLNDLLEPNDLVVAYAFTQVVSPISQKTILAVGSNDGIQVFLNGEKVHEYHPRNGRWLQKDDDFVPIHLQQGTNNLMLKIDEGAGDFGFVARFLDYEETLSAMRENLEQHKNLSLVTLEDSLVACFGQPYDISLFNSEGKVKIELIHEKAGKIAEQLVEPGFEATFPLQTMPMGFFKARATFLTRNDGEFISEVRHFNGKLKRHDTVKNLNDALLPLRDNTQAFFPIGTYGAPVEDYQILRDAGYNFVVASAENLDKVHAAGLFATVPVHGSIDEVRNKIKEYRDHPAVLSWMLYDEPGYNRADLLYIYNLYNAAYEADPLHPSYLVITNPAVYKTFGRCCDILSIDTYPIVNGDITHVGKNIADAYAFSDGDQPVWHCGQMFTWPGQRRPNPQEHRFMTYIALMKGARGLLWYTYKGYGQYLPQDDPVLWQAQKSLLQEIKMLSPLFMAPGFGTEVKSAQPSENLHTILKDSSIGTYLIAANQSKSEKIKPVFYRNICKL
ncbi:MAG: hypothetical protein H6696_08850 [Deferribacteres bacterium]|nr:hypothetical protein [Deferribacteres bacterium]